MRKAQLDRADWSCEDLEALRGWESAIDEGEQRIRTCDGQVRRWNFTTAALGVLADGRQAIMRMAVDVTERRDLEDALWETNRRMVGILDSITDGFSAIDRNEQVLYINDKLAEMIPCSREEVLGRPFREIFPVPTAVARAIQRCLTERTTEHVEHYLPARQRFYEMRFYPTSEGLAALVRDISERKRFEHKLASSEQRFRSLFESNMLGIMFANRRTGEVLDCNDAMLQVVGYSREDLEQGKVNWIQMTAPEWRDVDRLAAQGVGEGPLVPYEKEYLHKDGRRIPALVGGAPFNGSDDIVFAFVLDRTEQKRLQRQVEHDRRTLQAIVSGAPIAIVLVTEEGSVHLWNPAAEKLFGWQAIEVLGKKIPVIVQERAAPFLEGIRRIMSGFEFPETPRPVICRCGKVLTVLAKAMPARDEQGNVIGALLLMRPTDAA